MKSRAAPVPPILMAQDYKWETKNLVNLALKGSIMANPSLTLWFG